MSTPATSKTHKPSKKGLFALTGEAFAVLGEEIKEGKDKVVEVVADKFTAAKEKILSLTHKEKKVVVKKANPVGKKITAAKKVIADSRTTAMKTVQKAARKVSHAK